MFASFTLLLILISRLGYTLALQQPNLTYGYSFQAAIGSEKFVNSTYGLQLSAVFTNATYSGPSFNGTVSVPGLGYGLISSSGGINFDVAITGTTSEGDPFNVHETGYASPNGTSITRQAWTLPSNSSFAALAEAYVLCQATISTAAIQGDCYFVH